MMKKTYKFAPAPPKATVKPNEGTSPILNEKTKISLLRTRTRFISGGSKLELRKQPFTINNRIDDLNLDRKISDLSRARSYCNSLDPIFELDEPKLQRKHSNKQQKRLSTLNPSTPSSSTSSSSENTVNKNTPKKSKSSSETLENQD